MFFNKAQSWLNHFFIQKISRNLKKRGKLFGLEKRKKSCRIIHSDICLLFLRVIYITSNPDHACLVFDRRLVFPDWPPLKLELWALYYKKRLDIHPAVKTMNILSHGWDLVCGWDVTEWLERLTVNVKFATVLVSIPASSDTVESEGQQMKQCWIKKLKNKKIQKIPPV